MSERIDLEKIREKAKLKYKIEMDKFLKLQELTKMKLFEKNPILKSVSFKQNHATGVVVANDTTPFKLFDLRVPYGFTGFLNAISLTPLLPGSKYEILIDGAPLEAYSDIDGYITRQIGEFQFPTPLSPPIVFHDRLLVNAINNSGNSWTVGFSCDGLYTEKPKIYNNNNIFSNFIDPDRFLEIAKDLIK